MKRIRVQFVEDQSWKLPVIVTAICCSMAMGLSGWRWRQDQLAKQALDTQVAAAKRQAAEVQAKLNAPDPQKPQKEAFAKLLRVDLNKVFTIIETIDEPGARLTRMELDASGNLLRLEYELDSVATGAKLTIRLNAGYERGPWQLTSVSASGSSQQGAAAAKFHGAWFAAVDQL